MKSRPHGFTVIELLIVIGIVGILSAIAFNVWRGVTDSSNDRAREGDVRAWVSSFENYKSRFSVYPALPTGDAPGGDVTLCLGSFSSYSSKCGQYGSSTATKYIAASGSATLLTEAAKMGKVPVNTGPAIRSTLVGPLVYLTQTTSVQTVTVTAKFIDFFEGANCPTDFTNISASLPASIAQVLSGLPSGTTPKACALVKTFTYTYN